jgi:hypothetical protein
MYLATMFYYFDNKYENSIPLYNTILYPAVKFKALCKCILCHNATLNLHIEIKRFNSCIIQLISTNQNISYTLFVINRHFMDLIKTATGILNTKFYNSVTCVIILNCVILAK